MFDLWKKYSGIIIVVIIVIAIILFIYFYGKHQGKKYVPNDIKIPLDTQSPGTPGIYNPGPVTDAIFEDLDEVAGVHETGPYIAALKLSNSQLAAVYNDWNQRYAKDFNSKTIIQAINSDFTIWNYDWSVIAGQLVNRFRSLPGAQG